MNEALPYVSVVTLLVATTVPPFVFVTIKVTVALETADPSALTVALIETGWFDL
jgi:hypothetical protein